MAVKPGYKQTDVGVIPEDWAVTSLGKLCWFIADGTHYTPEYVESGVPFYSVENVTADNFTDTKFITRKEHSKLIKRCKPEKGDILLTRIGTLGETRLIDWDVDASIYVSLALLKPNNPILGNYLYNYSKSRQFVKDVEKRSLINAVPQKINMGDIAGVPIPIPEDETEQRAIAAALSDVDALLAALDALIAKKRLIKQGAMQELLTGQRRLPGFSGEWETRTLGEIVDCLDHLRIPLNETQRKKMQGDIPYCGANGVLDYVNDYVIDDDIILIAEDGGYFDEYTTRPIAYRMSGKCWVNNHAHILKAKEGINQDFVFFSLVHKNILPYLSGGTRAKLNKFEMYKIEIILPKDENEQTAIANILNDMDAEIQALEQRRAKTRLLKQGMMQELLTGRIRLI